MTNPLSRIPRRLLGGRVHTGTLALVVVFVALLVVYGQRSDHYARVDAESARPAPVTSSTTTQEYVPTATTRSSSRTPSSAPSSTSTDPTGTSDESSSNNGTDSPDGATTTTPAPGVQLPTIPGLRLPGQTPTTPPAR